MLLAWALLSIELNGYVAVPIPFDSYDVPRFFNSQICHQGLPATLNQKKHEKIVFNWRVVNNEARYVPKTAGTTSASGLNK